jgi:hypothetical protein
MNLATLLHHGLLVLPSCISCNREGPLEFVCIFVEDLANVRVPKRVPPYQVILAAASKSMIPTSFP